MQLHRDHSDANLIRAWESGRVRIGEQWFTGHLIVSPEQIVDDWVIDDLNRLDIDDFAAALAMEPQILLLGTGEARLLPDVRLMAAFAERGIGLEVMTTPAACRTFNVLVQEHREVVAALVSPRPLSPAAP